MREDCLRWASDNRACGFFPAADQRSAKPGALAPPRDSRRDRTDLRRGVALVFVNDGAKSRLQSRPPNFTPRLGKIRRRFVPIHRIPPCREIVGAFVLIFEIIGVLPHIDAQHHPLNALFERRVLIGRRDDRELAVLADDQPRPARAEAAETGRVDFLNELGLRAKRRSRSRLSDRRSALSRRPESSAPKRTEWFQ